MNKLKKIVTFNWFNQLIEQKYKWKYNCARCTKILYFQSDKITSEKKYFSKCKIA